jgi:hypothetical protein
VHLIAPTHDIDLERAEPPSLSDAVGGPWGMAESTLPATAFVAAYAVSGSDTNLSAAVAAGLGLVLAAVRLAKRESPRHALTGLAGIAFAAFIAARSGKAENFFLPGLLANLAYCSAFLISIAARRPLVGVLVSQLQPGHHHGWREDPIRRATFTRASWLWAGLFGIRLAVQLPLYLAGLVVALGVAKTAMGLPLFALGIWLTWLLVRTPAAEESPPADYPSTVA